MDTKAKKSAKPQNLPKSFFEVVADIIYNKYANYTQFLAFYKALIHFPWKIEN